MKKYKINILILILVSLIVMYLTLKDDFYNTISYLANVNLLWIVVSILFIFLYSFFQSLSLNLFLKKIRNDYKLKDTIILNVISQFFSAITPFASGGQPSLIYILKKQGIKITDSVSVLLQNFLTYQVALIITSTIIIIVNCIFGILPSNNFINKFMLIGYFINVFVFGITLFLSVAKRTNIELFNKIMNLILKFKFIKNKESLKEKISNKVDDFYNTTIYFSNNIKILVKSILFNIIGLLCLYSVPFFVFFSIREHSIVNIIQSIVCCCYTYLAGSFIPIPGGTGGLEYGFIQFFQNYTVGSTLSAGMLIWRFLTYYLVMILGFLLFVFYRKEMKK